jgi:transposase
MSQRPLRRKARQTKDRRPVASRRSARLEQMNWNAAGIDVGAESHWVAVPSDRDTEPVRRFATCTVDLYALADWLSQCGIETVVMESTGVYWIPVFEVLEERGFAVHLVDPHPVKQVPGRKTDVQDCQWLRELQTYGLLRGAFRPTEAVCVLRSYLRQRHLLIEEASRTIQHMQKALEHMHRKLTEVVSDVTGHTGMGIIRAILAGERDPQALAARRDGRCTHDQATIAKAMKGTWRQEHLFALRQAVEHYEFTQQQLVACDAQIEAWLQTFASQVDLETAPLEPSRKSQRRQGNALAFDVRRHL